MITHITDKHRTQGTSVITPIFEGKRLDDMSYLELRRHRQRAERLASNDSPLVMAAALSGVNALNSASQGYPIAAATFGGAFCVSTAGVVCAEYEARALRVFEDTHPARCKPCLVVCNAIGKACIIL